MRVRDEWLVKHRGFQGDFYDYSNDFFFSVYIFDRLIKV